MANLAAEKRSEVDKRFNQYTRIAVMPIPGMLGAEVDCGDVRHFDEETAIEIRRAWLDHLVLLFRGPCLSDDELIVFSRQFGDLENAPPTTYEQNGVRSNPFVTVISNVVENGVAIGGLGNDEAVWHTDMSYNEVPPSASILHALEVTSLGGETGFLNMYHALETLPETLRCRIDGLTILNDGSYNSAGFKRRVSISATHPVVRTHPETGCDALYLGRRPYARITELAPEESEALLDELWTHATRAEFAWHHKWRAGDILVWDNRCCMHHRNSFSADTRRIMHRTQVVGTKPVRGISISGREPHARSSWGETFRAD